jgi:pescadillo
MTRGQAVRKLQVSLSDFRRLCILKGIYPRDPKNRKKISRTGSTSGTYYWAKDIQFLLHEPLLGTLREMKSYAKKVARYTRKRDFAKVSSLEEHMKPQYSLDHLIKERYPTFADALRDLDDGLSMLYLFAALPNTSNLGQSRVEKRMAMAPGFEQLSFAHDSASLLREFEAYLIKEGCVRRSFISIKGIYYQAEIMGQTVTWIVPHERSTPVPSDVDFRVMHTFLEFYQTLIGFVNFKLFSRVGWSYPLAPTMLRKSEIEDESAQYRPVLLLEDLPKTSVDSSCTGIFANMTFFLSREVPRHSLALLVQNCGGSVGWEALDASSPITEDSPAITHQIIDRPNLAKMYSDRIYVQPQWVFDCLNAGKCLDPAAYQIGAQLPPHMSPFVRPDEHEEEEAAREEVEQADGNEESQEVSLSVEQKKLAVSMLSKKKKKLYESMQRGIAIKTAEKERLAKRRAELDESTKE